MYHFIGIKGTGMASLAQIMKNLGYEVKGSDTLNNTHSEIVKIGCTPNELGSFNVDGYCGLKGGNLHLTNFRLWSKLCEEDLHKLILSQYVIDDTHNTLVVDNAQNELLVKYKWS